MPDANSDKAPRWIWWLYYGIFATLLFIGYGSLGMDLNWFGSPQTTTAGFNHDPEQWPICPGAQIIRFKSVNQVTVPLRSDCWSGEVTTPPLSAWRTSFAGDSGWAESWFVDGTVFKIVPDFHTDFGVRQGIFRLRGEGTAIVSISF